MFTNINTDDGNAAERVAAVIDHECASCTGLTGLQLTLCSSKGLKVTWSDTALSNLLCRGCHGVAASVRLHR